MWVGARWGSVWLASVGLSSLSACGQSARDAEGAGSGGSAGTTAQGGSGGGGGGCVTSGPLLREIPRVELPARVSGTLCAEVDRLAVAFPSEPEEGLPYTIGVHLEEGAGAYSVSVYQNSANGIEPLKPPWGSNVYTLSGERTGFYFMAGDNGFEDDHVELHLTGSPGFVAINVERPVLAPALGCEADYSQFPIETPPLPLPAVLEGALCNVRDSQAWAVTVEGGRPVTVTLENPLAIQAFTLGIHEGETAEYEYLPVSAGEVLVTLGLVANFSISFTPLDSGIVAFSAGAGNSLGEAFRLRVEQP
jgi:hypothetical protein